MTFIEKVKTIYTFHKLVFDNEDNNLLPINDRFIQIGGGISWSTQNWWWEKKSAPRLEGKRKKKKK
jgi:hypothetical protein